MSRDLNDKPQHHDRSGPGHEAHQRGHEHAHGIGLYFVVFAALMLLLGATYLAGRFDWPAHGMGHFELITAFLIATLKGVLVVYFFMHIREASKLTRVFVVAALAWLVVLFALTLNDYFTRDWMEYSRGWEKDHLEFNEDQNASRPIEESPHVNDHAVEKKMQTD